MIGWIIVGVIVYNVAKRIKWSDDGDVTNVNNGKTFFSDYHEVDGDCFRCHGTGRVNGRTCRKCGGSGRFHRTTYYN